MAVATVVSSSGLAIRSRHNGVMKRTAAVVLMLGLSACAHQVTFDRPPAYVVGAARQSAGITVVIDQQTLERRVPIQSFMTGIANTWEVQPGDMLKQVAEIELPQVFSSYEFSEAYKEPTAGADWLVVAFTIPRYDFSDFRAKVTVQATVYEPGRRELIKKAYSAEGDSHGAKMFWTGALGMKSAIRQSSFDAYKVIFAELRGDLATLAARRRTTSTK